MYLTPIPSKRLSIGRPGAICALSTTIVGLLLLALILPATTINAQAVSAAASSAGCRSMGPTQIAFLPNANCQTYTLCIGQRAYQRRCPGQLHYNRFSKSCDSAQRAMCTPLKRGAAALPAAADL